jgi:DNA-directed RNA polymerase specialized sigma24 family protein
MQYKIDKLPKSQREAILDFYFRDLKLKEISFMRKVPIGTVKRRLHDGRKNLKIRLENEYE